MRILAAAVLLTAALSARAQAPAPDPESAPDVATIEIDGHNLFRVRGIEARPAHQRADEIASRITSFAKDPSFRPDTLRSDEQAGYTDIAAGSILVMRVMDADAAIEGFDRHLVAPVYVERIRRAITDYRNERARGALLASAGRVVAMLALVAAVLAVLVWLFRRGIGLVQRAFDSRVAVLESESRRIFRVENLWQALRGSIHLTRILLVSTVSIVALEYVLAQFPWTRGVSLHLYEYVSGPLGKLAGQFVEAIPSLILLAILFLACRYILSLARLYFLAVQSGSVRLQNFEPEWAQPTYNLVRIATIAFALVVAYPLIPGSDSQAFKGLSLLAGVVLSLASSSAIANIVAGYMIIFRRAFRIGDRVKIGQVVGAVTEMRMQVVHVRTEKNEEVTIPNAQILTSEVTNFSKPARDGRLALHTQVGIGYEVPWRQVEAMLLEAARRTSNIVKEPEPYVLHRALGDFAVTYEINAFTDRDDIIPRTYAELSRNILDQFNEHGVQIMTPNYETDPDTPKLVPKGQWFAPPGDGKRA